MDRTKMLSVSFETLFNNRYNIESAHSLKTIEQLLVKSYTHTSSSQPPSITLETTTAPVITVLGNNPREIPGSQLYPILQQTTRYKPLFRKSKMESKQSDARASLGAFPDELLGNIAMFVAKQRDLFNLCLVSKAFYREAIGFLYENVELTWYGRVDKIRRFTLTLVYSPRLASCVKGLGITVADYSDDSALPYREPSNNRAVIMRRQTEADLDDISTRSWRALATNRVIKAVQDRDPGRLSGMEDTIRRACVWGFYDALLALAICLTPNLKELRIHTPCIGDTPMSFLPELALDSGMTHCFGSLRKLSFHGDKGPWQGSLSAFLDLPTLETLEISNFIDRVNPAIEYWPISSAITSLTITRSYLSDETLYGLLGACNVLKNLRLSLIVRHPSSFRRRKIDCTEIIYWLQASKKTLENVSIVALCHNILERRGPLPLALLREFETLRRMFIPGNALIGYPADDELGQPWTKFRLRDTLPPGIEDLTIADPDLPEFRDNLVELARDCSERYPHLKRVAVYGNPIFACKKPAKLFRRAGVKSRFIRLIKEGAKDRSED